MDAAAYLNRSYNNASAWLAHSAENAGRFLLVLIAVELMSMPFTQYVWTWDHFLHGGIDFESSLLFFVVCLGLLLVLRHHCRKEENLRVARGRLSPPISDTDKSAAMLGTGVPLAFGRERPETSHLATFNFPLQI